MNILDYSKLLAQGMQVTLAAWFCAALISLILGTLFAIASCRALTSSKTYALIKLYTFIAKGIPAYVQILIAYFLIPALCGISLPAFAAACGALAFCSSGYVTEIIRAGINAVPKGQWQAAAVLGYSLPAQLKRIILPQAFRAIAPALFGEAEQLLKSTSLLATIGIAELTRTGMNIISRELNPVAVYATLAIIYLLFAAMLNSVLIVLEKRMRYGQR
ncbi:MAG: amino acid ABC transporter permease [Candidatus Babeliales bacterium]